MNRGCAAEEGKEAGMSTFVPAAPPLPPMPVYDEVMGLVRETADCLSSSGSFEGWDGADLEKILEIGLLTTRLTEMMSWVMAQRAVANGEISHEDGCRQFRLTNSSYLSEALPDQRRPLLPAEIAGIFDRSLQLYLRLQRLDAGLS